MKQVVNLFAGEIDNGTVDSGSLFLVGLDTEGLQEHVHRGSRTVRTNLAHIQVLAVNLEDGAEEAFEGRIILNRKRHRLQNVKCGVWNVGLRRQGKGGVGEQVQLAGLRPRQQQRPHHLRV